MELTNYESDFLRELITDSHICDNRCKHLKAVQKMKKRRHNIDIAQQLLNDLCSQCPITKIMDNGEKENEEDN